MSAFHHGQMETMKAPYVRDAGDLRVIRRFVSLRERQAADFARRARLPVIPDNCPACFRMPKLRQHMKDLLAQQEQLLPHLFAKLLHAMRPLMGECYGRTSDRQHRRLIAAG